MNKIKSAFKALAITMLVAVVANAQNAEWYSTGGGKEGKTFYISTEDDLKGLAQLVNSGFDNFSGKTIVLNADITLKDAHIPIGDDPKREFMGIFDGNGKAISDLSVSEVWSAGLFGGVGKGGQIKNITINVLRISATNKNFNAYAGGLAGYYKSTNAIENCIVNIRDSISALTLSGSSMYSGYSGGLVGEVGLSKDNTITITNSYTTGNVFSNGSSGGLVGSIYRGNATITNSYATGNVFGKWSSGGLVGSGNATITNSYATGDISGKWSGGLVGGGNATITNSYVTGNVSGSEDSGGLVGGGKVTIANSYATGDVSGEKNSGGLVGNSDNAIITDSYATSNISGKFSGGLVGNGSVMKISNSYARGDILIHSNGDRCGGGLIGSGTTIEIDNSFADGNISSRISDDYEAKKSLTGGLVGEGNRVTIKNSYARGDVSGADAKDIFSGGLIGKAEKTSTLANCYASGKITGANSGGIMGFWKEGNNTSVYFNNTAGNMTAVSGLPAGLLGVGVTEENLKKQETFKNWDFEKIWAIDAYKNDGYPHLQAITVEKKNGTKPKSGKLEVSNRDIDMGSGDGSRSKQEIMQVLNAHKSGIRNLYNKYLKQKPDFSGKVAIKFTIAPGGDIISIAIVSSTTGYAEFDNAIKNMVGTWKWKAIPKGNTTPTVTFNFGE